MESVPAFNRTASASPLVMYTWIHVFGNGRGARRFRAGSMKRSTIVCGEIRMAWMWKVSVGFCLTDITLKSREKTGRTHIKGHSHGWPYISVNFSRCGGAVVVMLHGGNSPSCGFCIFLWCLGSEYMWLLEENQALVFVFVTGGKAGRCRPASCVHNILHHKFRCGRDARSWKPTDFTAVYR